MTSIHDQAMNYVYQQVLQRLLGFFPVPNELRCSC